MPKIGDLVIVTEVDSSNGFFYLRNKDETIKGTSVSDLGNVINTYSVGVEDKLKVIPGIRGRPFSFEKVEITIISENT